MPAEAESRQSLARARRDAGGRAGRNRLAAAVDRATRSAVMAPRIDEARPRSPALVGRPDAEPLELAVQMAALQPELARGPRHLPAVSLERLEEDGALGQTQTVLELRLSGRAGGAGTDRRRSDRRRGFRGRRRQDGPRLLLGQPLAGRAEGQTLDQVAQLAHVAGKVVALQEGDRPVG